MSTPAHVALLAWFPITLVIFTLLRMRLAVLTTLLGAAMFLPENTAIELRGFPDLDKHSIGVLCAFFGILFVDRSALRISYGLRLPTFFFGLLVICAFLTVLTNGDRVVEAESDGLRLYDAVSMVAYDLLLVGLPFMIAANLIRSTEELAAAMSLMIMAGIVYSLPALIESRFSPQVHLWLYGFHPNDFYKSWRLGGYRPMVCMQTGLALAIFMLTALLAAMTALKGRRNPFGFPAELVIGYLLIVLVLCRSLGTLIYAAAFTPMFVLRTRALALVVLLMAVFILVYPALRASGIFPTERLVATAESFSPDRAQSLEFRFDNEDVLLLKAAERPLFGWGGFNRNRVFDPQTGRDMTITDGFWIIQLGQRGWIGLAIVLGLLLLPVVYCCRHIARVPTAGDRGLVLGVALIIVVRCVDMLPNGWFSVLPIYFAGALQGTMSALILGQHSKEAPPPEATLASAEPLEKAHHL